MLLDHIKVPPLVVKPIEPEHLVGDMIQPGHPLFGLIWINRERVSGTPCFYASRVPVITLFHCLAAGYTLDEFLDDFEGVTRDQALGVLDLATHGLIGRLDALESAARSQPAQGSEAVLVGT
jgi:uncharacterized protein (DUF433 family)